MLDHPGPAAPVALAALGAGGPQPLPALWTMVTEVSSPASAKVIAHLGRAIWAILTDASRYSTWDSGIEQVEGTIAPGEKVTLRTEAQPGRAYPVKVGDVDPGRRMTWTGGMPLGLFKGVRSFSLTPEENGSTRFHMREDFSGPLLPLIGRSMPDLGPSFERFANGLKAEAERSG